ncbi:MAG TPA: DUF1425 domain-containing protein [Phycisphaerales bacterium]|nr:DUF1425 domain-containing protein [Phycisphaerales bacterium]HMP36259.1 DUF1425 domain-containing protein [Phycisphaerales bacterium]
MLHQTAHSFLRLAAVTSVLLGAVACTTSPDPSPGRPDPYPAPGNNPKISVLDPNLQRGIAFQTATELPPGAAPLTVQVPVRNLSNFEYLIDYRFLFYDADGLELAPAMSWRALSLLPKQVQMLRANALDARAVDWRLEVKWAR